MKHLLSQNLIQSPCARRWNEMQGSDQRRFCEHCSKHVYNLSALSWPEAFLLSRFKKGNLCSRILIGQDGSIRTTRLSQRLRTLLAAWAAFLFGLTPLGAETPAIRPEKEKVPCKTPASAPAVAPTNLEMVGGDEILPLNGSHHSVKELQKRKRK